MAADHGFRAAPRLVVAVVFMVLVGAGIALVCRLALLPHGDWDAWAIWNLRARFLHRGGEHWADTFTNDIIWSHPDYPLLVSANVARLWAYAGGETTLAPQAVAAVFTLATLGLLVAAVARLRGPTQGLLAGLMLASTPLFLQVGSNQYADVPLGYYILATVVLLGFHEGPEKNGGLNALAGAMAALAAWTKNEGLLFVVVIVAVRLVVVTCSRGWKSWAREAAAFGLGAAAVAACVVYYKACLAPVNDLVAGQGTDATWARLSDLHRYWLVAKWFGADLAAIGPGTLFVLAVYFALLGRGPRSSGRSGRLTAWLVLALMLAGYFGVYLTTPNPLEAHLHTSLDRLLIQLWPLTLFAFFLTVASPEEALTRQAGRLKAQNRS
jgi:hypothetical protein